MAPGSLRSYANRGEDRLINDLISHDVKYYVDVGCNHPFVSSNTISLYMLGWKGLCIDANPVLINQHKRTRINDISLCEVISDREENKKLTIFVNDKLSTISDVLRQKYISTDDKLNESIVLSSTLEKLFYKYNVPEKFGLLSIDVEGHDFEVLRSFNIRQYRPDLIVIEMHDFDMLNPSDSEIYNYLTSNGYKLKSYMVPNGFFKSDT